MIVNSNQMSLFSRRAVSSTGNALDVTAARLASGLRINTAADDAAGMAISDRLTSVVNGQGQARRNANDGVSMAQTAEGALQQSTDLLQRIRQLAVQAANDTNSSQDRASLQQEVDQLIAEFDRISVDTEFNSRKLLDGSTLTTKLHVGFKAQQNISLDIRSARAADLYSYDMAGEVNTNFSMQAAQTATSDGSAQQRNRLQTQNLTINARNTVGTAVLQAGLSAKDVATRINQAMPKKEGLVTARAETYAIISLAGAQSAAMDLKLNGVSVQAYASQANTDVDNLVDALNQVSSATKVVASKQQLSSGGYGVLLHAAEGDDIQLGQVAITMGNGAVGTMNVQGVYANAGSFGSAGSAVSLTAGGSTASRNTTVGGRVLMTSDAAYTITHNAGGSTGGLFSYGANTIVSSSKGKSLVQASVLTTNDSNVTLGLVDAVLARVANYRSTLGAMQNRLALTQDSLGAEVENATASRSRMRDADFAEETANLARVQVVRQAGAAMLTQANASASRALDLLR